MPCGVRIFEVRTKKEPKTLVNTGVSASFIVCIIAQNPSISDGLLCLENTTTLFHLKIYATEPFCIYEKIVDTKPSLVREGGAAKP